MCLKAVGRRDCRYGMTDILRSFPEAGKRAGNFSWYKSPLLPMLPIRRPMFCEFPIVTIIAVLLTIKHLAPPHRGPEKLDLSNSCVRKSKTRKDLCFQSQQTRNGTIWNNRNPWGISLLAPPDNSVPSCCHRIPVSRDLQYSVPCAQPFIYLRVGYNFLSYSSSYRLGEVAVARWWLSHDL